MNTTKVFSRFFVANTSQGGTLKSAGLLAPMFPLIFCGLCAQKFWRERTFSGNSSRIKTVFASEIRWIPKKKKKNGLHPEMERFLRRKFREDQKKKVFSLNWSGFCARKVYKSALLL